MDSVSGPLSDLSPNWCLAPIRDALSPVPSELGISCWGTGIMRGRPLRMRDNARFSRHAAAGFSNIIPIRQHEISDALGTGDNAQAEAARPAGVMQKRLGLLCKSARSDKWLVPQAAIGTSPTSSGMSHLCCGQKWRTRDATFSPPRSCGAFPALTKCSNG